MRSAYLFRPGEEIPCMSHAILTHSPNSIRSDQSLNANLRWGLLEKVAVPTNETWFIRTILMSAIRDLDNV